MDRFHAITAFARVVETGSFARAAERLGVSVSSVSRQVAELEAHLDARLLNRTTRRLSLTESGRAFHERCVQLLADLEEAEQSANAGTVDAARHAAPHRRRSPSARAISRRRSPSSSRATRRCASTSSSPTARSTSSRRASTSPCASARSAARTSSAAGSARRGSSAARRPRTSPRTASRRTPEDLAAHACLTYEYAPQRNVWSFRDRRGRRAQRPRSPGRSTPTTGASSRRSPSRASASPASPTSSSGPTSAPAGSCRCSPASRPPATAISRRLPEPPAPFGEGARVHRLPGRALRDALGFAGARVEPARRPRPARLTGSGSSRQLSSAAREVGHAALRDDERRRGLPAHLLQLAHRVLDAGLRCLGVLGRGVGEAGRVDLEADRQRSHVGEDLRFAGVDGRAATGRARRPWSPA